MRHIELTSLLEQIFADDPGKQVKARLHRAHKKSAAMVPADRKPHIDRNGPNKWKPVKDKAMLIRGRKCWYTEVELTGAPLVIDHYRPVNHYWWLAYDPENYRIACPWANSPEHNANHGCAGGKGTQFPLLPPGHRAIEKNQIHIEKPVILDPCNANDCKLLAFQADGRPVIHPMFAKDTIAVQRVEQSKIILNLDHPDINSKREQLCQEIARDVRIHEALPPGDPEQQTIKDGLVMKLGPTAPFSIAARFYLSPYRYLDWVETILATA